jgi:hypothetical protein
VRDDLSGEVSAIERGTSGPFLQVYGSNFAGISGTNILPSAGISAWNVSYVNATIGQVNITYNVLASANSGERQFTLANGVGSSPPVKIWITDPTPEITTVSPDRPWQPGEVITVTLTGKGFGLYPEVALQVRAGGDQATCLGSDQATISPPVQDGLIVFTKAVPANSPGCQFDIIVTSKGTSGNFFAGPAGSPKAQSASKRASVLNTVSQSPIRVFIVHGLSDGPQSMAPLAGTLSASLPAVGGSNGGFVIDHLFAYNSVRPNACDPIGTAAAALGNYVIATTVPNQRMAFIGHSMGGLVIRKMMADGRLPTAPSAERYVVGLATLGTPHLGYPYLSIDESVKCANQVRDMDSMLMDGGSLDSTSVLRSDFLRTLRTNWRRSDFGHKFLAAGGRACDTPVRSDFSNQNGCRMASPFSDGVVCDDSAGLYYPQEGDTVLGPTTQYFDAARQFQHATNIGYPALNVMCPNMAATSIVEPSVITPLFQTLRDFFNAL